MSSSRSGEAPALYSRARKCAKSSQTNSYPADVQPVTKSAPRVVKGEAGDETTTLSTTLVCFPDQVTVGIGEIIEEKLEAPPGLEPGVEVLQTERCLPRHSHFSKQTRVGHDLSVRCPFSCRPPKTEHLMPTDHVRAHFYGE
jgi:hypothetical protein